MRVVITGLGCITPIGATVPALLDSLATGRTGITPFDPALFPGLRFTHLGRVLDFDPLAGGLSSSQIVATDRTAQFAVLAARQAVAESNLIARHAPDQIAIITGCSVGGRGSEEPETSRLYLNNTRIHPLSVARSMSSAGASHIAIENHITGPVLNISTACSSATHAIGLAFHMVRSGQVTAAIAGGHEAPLTWAFLRGWDSMRVVSPTLCRPFAEDRDGMTIAEGAAMLTLETLDAALARNAPIYAEIVGFGMSSDAHHITQPQSDGAAAAMRKALADAGEDPATAAVAYINAHGTGTRANDAVEAEAIHKLFGPRAPHIPVSSTKSLHGHSIGASGAIEALATILALHTGQLPATAGITSVDPTLNLDIITAAPRPLPPGPALALSNSLAFGGLNAVVALRRFA